MIRYKLDSWKTWEKEYFLRKGEHQGTFAVCMFGTSDENIFPHYYHALSTIPLEVEGVDAYQKSFFALTTVEQMEADMEAFMVNFFHGMVSPVTKTRKRARQKHRLLIYWNTHCWWISAKDKTKHEEIKITPKIYVSMISVVSKAVNLFNAKKGDMDCELLLHFQTCFHPKKCLATEKELLKILENFAWCWIIVHRDTTENEGAAFFDIELQKQLATLKSVDQCVDLAAQRAFGYPGATLLHMNEKLVYEYLSMEEVVNPLQKDHSFCPRWKRGNFQKF